METRVIGTRTEAATGMGLQSRHGLPVIPVIGGTTVPCARETSPASLRGVLAVIGLPLGRTTMIHRVTRRLIVTEPLLSASDFYGLFLGDSTATEAISVNANDATLTEVPTAQSG